MDELIVQSLLFFGELLLELAPELFFDWLIRASTKALDSQEPRSPLVTALGYSIVGGFIGGISLIVFPHPIFHPLRIRGLSLVISPVLVAIAMSAIGAHLRKNGNRVVAIETFPVAFAFAFSMALVRFLFTS